MVAMVDLAEVLWVTSRILIQHMVVRGGVEDMAEQEQVLALDPLVE